jgi:molybdopterin-guanine dinucleotide biosynthesis protein MobB
MSPPNILSMKKTDGNMQRVHIIGRSNHGKTRLIVELVQELTAAGLQVGTIKHTHHRHELDLPGKDSHRHREAGAAVAGILSPSLSAVFLPAGEASATKAERYAALEPVFASCDLVLVEGDSQTAAPKLEVWRSELGTTPLASEDHSILAVVTDDHFEGAREVIPRGDVRRLAHWIAQRFVK